MDGTDLPDEDVLFDSRLVAEVPDRLDRSPFEFSWRHEVRDALEQLTPPQREIVERRFGFLGERETLEAIGRDLQLTRERVRQIQARAMRRLAFLLDDVLEDGAG